MSNDSCVGDVCCFDGGTVARALICGGAVRGAVVRGGPREARTSAGVRLTHRDPPGGCRRRVWRVQEAWRCESDTIQVPSHAGSNVLPMVHVTDVCSVSVGVTTCRDNSQHLSSQHPIDHHLLLSRPSSLFPCVEQLIDQLSGEDPSAPYIVAVDNARSTLAEIAAAISTNLGPGGVTFAASAEDAAALAATNRSALHLQVRHPSSGRTPL